MWFTPFTFQINSAAWDKPNVVYNTVKPWSTKFEGDEECQENSVGAGEGKRKFC